MDTIKDTMVKLISPNDDELIGEKIQLFIHDRRTYVYLKYFIFNPGQKLIFLI